MVKREGFNRLIVTEPGEWRLMQDMQNWSAKLGIEVAILPDNRFIADHAEFERWADGKAIADGIFLSRDAPQNRLLMDGDEPLGGQWNYDSENRKKLPKGHMPPPRLHFPPDEITQNVLHVVKTHFGNHVGTLDKFAWPVTASQAQSNWPIGLIFACRNSAIIKMR